MKKESYLENYYEEGKLQGELGDGVSDTFLPFWELELCNV